jgi:hypothetical protein
MSLFKIAIFGLLGLPVGAGQIPGSAFRIAVIDGQGAWNNVQARLAHDPVVQVEDRNHKPIVGAYVEFDTPNGGAGAVFANGTTHFSSTTNSDGMATAAGLRNNGIPGPFVISVHVSFEGQSIGEAVVRQTNLPRNIVGTSNSLQDSKTPAAKDSSLPPNVLGIALGDQFLLNGAPTPSNANLFQGSRIETLGSPTTVFLHDKCEFLVGPHSAVTFSEHQVHVEKGAVRAKHFGNCKMGYGGMWVAGVGENADGVLSISGESMEVASVSGDLQVVNSSGEIISTVSSGSVTTLGASTGSGAASGASVGVPGGISGRTAVLLGVGAGVALAGLGLAVDAILQPTPTSP